MRLFLTTPGVISLLQDCGVDAVALLDSMDMIYEEKTRWGSRGLRFIDFVEVVLNMRGTNPATVKDVKEQMRLAKMASQSDSMKTNRLFEAQLRKMRDELVMMMHELRRLIDSDVGSEDAASMLLGSLAPSMFGTASDGADEDDSDDDDQGLRRDLSQGSADDDQDDSDYTHSRVSSKFSRVVPTGSAETDTENDIMSAGPSFGQAPPPAPPPPPDDDTEIIDLEPEPL